MKRKSDAIHSLDWMQIRDCISEKQLEMIGCHEIVDSIGSTNDWAMGKCGQEEDIPAVCIAEHQSQGRGRKGRQWMSPQTENIYMSLAWSFVQGPASVSGLGLAIGVVLADMLSNYGLAAKLKWPNDVWVNEKKIAGILIEARVRANQGVCAVIGVGVNYNMSDASAEGIDQQWTDIVRESLGSPVVNRNQLAGQLLAALMDACQRYERQGFADFSAQWAEYDVCKGRQLDIVTETGIEQGLGLGINGDGGLRVLVNGDEKVVYAADVSIKVGP